MNLQRTAPRRGGPATVGDEVVAFAIEGLEGQVLAPHHHEDLASEVARLVDPASATRTLHWGRNYLYTVPFRSSRESFEVVVKQFRQHGLKARARRWWRGTKAASSFRVARALTRWGILTPEPILMAESTDPRGPSFYVCRYLGDAVEARYLLRALNAGEERDLFPEIDPVVFLRSLATLIRRLHERELWHRDMTGGNLLIRRHETDRQALDLYLLDLNRARMGRRLTTNERIRELCRVPILRPEHQEVFLHSYWGAPPSRQPLKRGLYRSYHWAFLWKNRSKKGVRSGVRRMHDLLLPRRRPHAHIPPPRPNTSRRDRVVWDPLSDQPHQHASRTDKLVVRLGDARSHLQGASVVLSVLPRIWRRYRQLHNRLHEAPVPWGGMGICIGPGSPLLEAQIEALEKLGTRHVLLRLHPWDGGLESREELARELFRRGYDVAFAVAQNRDLVRDPQRWRDAMEEVADRFYPFAKQFQIGQAINRSKWGIWTCDEYVQLVTIASEVLRRRGEVEILGPAVIDFEFHTTAMILNLPHEGLDFDVVSSLLYVDRRGAPENRQAGLSTVEKVVLLKAIAETSKRSGERSWITEVNWPLKEGPHSPAGRDVAVNEETQADYLVRYYLLSLATGMVERVYWWQLVARGYGLLDPAEDTLRPRPSFNAMVNLRRNLDGSRFLGPLPAPQNSHLYHFEGPEGQEIVVGWSTNGSTEATLPRPCHTALDRDGGQRAGAGSGSVTLTQAPAYFFLHR